MRSFLRLLLVTLLVGAGTYALVPIEADACGGTPRPPQCSRTIWLAKSVPNVVAIRPNGSATIRMTLVPFVVWSGACPNPIAASLTVTLRCSQLGGGSTTIGPLSVGVNTPTSPGLQPLSNGTNTFIYQAPPGTFSPSGSYRCRIIGNYGVAFQGVPQPLITGIGDATAYMVPESPLSNGRDIPELNVTFLQRDTNTSFVQCRRGDQAMMHFLVENNHPTQGVTLDLNSVGRQLGRLPSGISTPSQAFDSMTYSVSNPNAGTDVFTAGFADTMNPYQLLEHGDPNDVNPFELTRRIRLDPCESRIISIAQRSHGMCADGSCGERDVRLLGVWEDGDSAIGCASAVMVVTTTPPKTPLCEMVDDIKAADSMRAGFSPAQFLAPNVELHHTSTHYPGNIHPRFQQHVTELAGKAIQGDVPLDSNSRDYVRSEHPISGVQYTVVGRPLWNDLVPFTNRVTVFGLDKAEGEVAVPLIVGPFSAEEFQVEYDAVSDTIRVYQNNDLVYNDLLANLKNQPPRGWRVDEGTCRIFQKRYELGDGHWLATNPHALTRMLGPGSVANIFDDVQVFDAFDDTDLDWTSTVSGSGLIVSETPNGDARVRYLPGDMTPDPAKTQIRWIDFGADDAINAPYPMPVGLRVKPLPEPLRDIAIEQVDFHNPFRQLNARQAIAGVKYDPEDEARFLNILMRRPGGRTNVWMVRNLLLPPFPDDGQMIDYWIDLGWLGFDDGDDVTLLEIHPIVTEDPILNLDPGDSYPFTPIDVGNRVNKTPPGIRDANTIVERIDSIEIRLPRFVESPNLDWVYRGCEMPNIDLDSSRHNPDEVPGTTGDWNACVPAAASNSLMWLKDQHPEIEIPDSHRELMEKLARLMSHTQDSGTFARPFIEGKLALIDSLKLPIRVKFQGMWFDTNDVNSPNTQYGHSARNDNDSSGAHVTWDWLVREMKDGEDVELTFGYYDSSNNRNGGHCITVTGVSDVRTARGIYYKDDGDQSDTGGTRQKFVNWDTSATGWPYLTGISTTARRCWVEMAVSESYDSTITYPKEKTPGIKLTQFDFKAPFTIPKSMFGAFTYEVQSSQRLRFMNVFARRTANDDPIWLVRNMVLPPSGEIEQVQNWVDLRRLGFRHGDSVEGYWIIPEIDDEVLVGFDAGEIDDRDFEYHECFPTTYSVGPGYTPTDVGTVSYTSPPSSTFAKPDDIDSVYRGCEIPNIDLDSAANGSEEGGYAGDWNACAPAGVANSMQWLIDQHDELSLSSAHREKLEELSELMGRGPGDGAGDEEIIEAKLAFVDKHKLPIRVKFQARWLGTDDIESPDTTGSNGDPNRGGYGHVGHNRKGDADDWPTWEFAQQELENEEDVEIGIQWYTRDGRYTGKAHIVTLSGASNANGTRRIWFKDDQNQEGKGGMSQAQVTWDTTENGDPIIPEMGNGDTIAYISSVFSESYDPDVTFDTIAGTSGVFDVSDASRFELSVVKNPSLRGEDVEIRFAVPTRDDVEVAIYDLIGREVMHFDLGRKEAGAHSVRWDGSSLAGRVAASGVYIVRLRVGDTEEAVRVVRQ